MCLKPKIMLQNSPTSENTPKTHIPRGIQPKRSRPVTERRGEVIMTILQSHRKSWPDHRYPESCPRCTVLLRSIWSDRCAYPLFPNSFIAWKGGFRTKKLRFSRYENALSAVCEPGEADQGDYALNAPFYVNITEFICLLRLYFRNTGT